jgi:hypothetical protein
LIELELYRNITDLVLDYSDFVVSSFFSRETIGNKLVRKIHAGVLRLYVIHEIFEAI